MSLAMSSMRTCSFHSMMLSSVRAGMSEDRDRIWAAFELLRTALREGLRTLRQDGIDKVWAGVTTIEEVRASSNA